MTLTLLFACFVVLALKLMTGLVEVGVTVSVQLQTTQRQCDMEKSKREHDRASDRLEELQATISEVTHANTEPQIHTLVFSVFYAQHWNAELFVLLLCAAYISVDRQ